MFLTWLFSLCCISGDLTLPWCHHTVRIGGQSLHLTVHHPVWTSYPCCSWACPVLLLPAYSPCLCPSPLLPDLWAAFSCHAYAYSGMLAASVRILYSGGWNLSFFRAFLPHQGDGEKGFCGTSRWRGRHRKTCLDLPLKAEALCIPTFWGGQLVWLQFSACCMFLWAHSLQMDRKKKRKPANCSACPCRPIFHDCTAHFYLQSTPLSPVIKARWGVLL